MRASGHQQLISVINPSKGIRRSPQIGMVLLDQAAIGSFELSLGGAGCHLKHCIGIMVMI